MEHARGCDSAVPAVLDSNASWCSLKKRNEGNPHFMLVSTDTNWPKAQHRHRQESLQHRGQCASAVRAVGMEGPSTSNSWLPSTRRPLHRHSKQYSKVWRILHRVVRNTACAEVQDSTSSVFFSDFQAKVPETPSFPCASTRLGVFESRHLRIWRISYWKQACIRFGSLGSVPELSFCGRIERELSCSRQGTVVYIIRLAFVSDSYIYTRSTR